MKITAFREHVEPPLDFVTCIVPTVDGQFDFGAAFVPAVDGFLKVDVTTAPEASSAGVASFASESGCVCGVLDELQ